MKILQSQQLKLVPMSSEHEADFVRLSNIPEINHRINKPLLYDNTHFAELLGKLQKTPSLYVWMIEQNGTIVGVINNAARLDPRMFQGGYWVDPVYWGKGYASAALALVRDFLFEECDAQRIQALVEPDNAASIRVLEKCGYEREGLLRKFYPSINRGLVDVLMYAAVR